MLRDLTCRLSGALCLIIDFILILNLLALLLLPFWLNVLYEQPNLFGQLDGRQADSRPAGLASQEYPADVPPGSYPFYLAFLYVCGLSTAWILFEGRRILKRVAQREPFHARQSRSFQHIALALGLLTAAFVVKIFTYNTFLTLFCAVVFFILIFIALLLADLFRQAYLVKTENELTI
ncbi:MAG: DUF2975 domain-containing protein [Clostridiaceae bacterium]|jgi:hypothetical protein|nr:DUF2975 domain-containing protein [Clostridiaceae bacterium]